MNGEFIIRILIGGLLGGIIGLERSLRSKEAGVRTHFLVALGSALLMVVSQNAFSGQFDASRVAAQVVSGIGFIGAGTIIFQKNVVRGLTTAAGIWVAGAIGLACGAGMFVIAAAATALSILILETMHFVLHHHMSPQLSCASVNEEDLFIVLEALKKEKALIHSYSLRRESDRFVFSFDLRLRDEAHLRHICDVIKALPTVTIEQIG